jgi:hypothetical protein
MSGLEREIPFCFPKSLVIYFSFFGTLEPFIERHSLLLLTPALSCFPAPGSRGAAGVGREDVGMSAVHRELGRAVFHGGLPFLSRGHSWFSRL